MTIIHKIDDFLQNIFPIIKADTNPETIKAELERFYTYGPFRPTVTIEDGYAKIEIDTSAIVSQEADFKRAIRFCEERRYTQAKPILEGLIEKNPTNSEYHRVLGQVLSEEGNQDDAVDCLIYALRWNPKNHWALLMMGNIYQKHKKDTSTALNYFNQVIKLNPNDHLVVNNIGTNLMQQGKIAEAKTYFEQATAINPDYPNSIFGLGMVANIEGRDVEAFTYAISCMKKCKYRDQLFQNAEQLAISASKKAIESGKGKTIFFDFLRRLEEEGEKEIDVVADNAILTAAKFEFAETYNREKHVLRYKPDYPATEHLQMHELCHLYLVIQARKAGRNHLFTSTQKHKTLFIKNIETAINNLRKSGIPEASLTSFATSLFQGLNSQIYNAPIDLFIEEWLYRMYPDLRPYQFLSLTAIAQENLKAVTDKRVTESSPRHILYCNKIYNLVQALQYKELFGIDLIKNYKASHDEYKNAETMYAEFKKMLADKKPGQEYNLVHSWADKLKLGAYFELIEENEYRNLRTDPDALIETVEQDPLKLQSDIAHKQREQDAFDKTQKDIGLNMAVVMFMVDALQYFKNVSKEQIKKVAHEIAILGTQGIRPDVKDYKLKTVPDKAFSGYHLLSYYYVSWTLAIPEMVKDLNLPFDKEYKLALTMFNKPKL